MTLCTGFQRQLVKAFLGLDPQGCRDAVLRGDFAEFDAQLPRGLRQHVESCSDCSNDVLWLLQIRDELDVESFPCLHLAYGCSRHAGHVLKLQHDMFSIVIDRDRDHRIVIGYCPWCGIELNVSASQDG